MGKNTSYSDELNKIEKRNQKIQDKKRINNKCYGCVWGRWIGNKYYCMFPKCIK